MTPQRAVGIVIVVMVGMVVVALLAWSGGTEKCANMNAQVYALQEQLEFSQDERQKLSARIAKLEVELDVMSTTTTRATTLTDAELCAALYKHDPVTWLVAKECQ